MNPFENYLRRQVIIYLAFFSVIFALIYLTIPYPILNGDLKAFLTGAKIIASPDRAQLYDIDTQYHIQNSLLAAYGLYNPRLQPYLYLPVFAVYFLPLIFLPFSLAYFLNLFFMLSLVFIFLYLVKKHFPFPLYWLVPFAFTPQVYALLISQPSIAVSLSFMLMYHFFSGRRYFISGLSTVLLLFKIQYFVIGLPFLLLARPPKKFILGLLCGLLVVIGTCLLLVGPESLAAYPAFIQHFGLSANGGNFHQQVHLPLILTIILLPLILVFVARIKPTLPSTLVCLPFFLCIFSGHTYSQDLALLLFPLFVLLKYRPRLAVILLLVISIGFSLVPVIISWLILLSGLYLLYAFRLENQPQKSIM